MSVPNQSPQEQKTVKIVLRFEPRLKSARSRERASWEASVSSLSRLKTTRLVNSSARLKVPSRIDKSRPSRGLNGSTSAKCKLLHIYLTLELERSFPLSTESRPAIHIKQIPRLVPRLLHTHKPSIVTSD